MKRLIWWIAAGFVAVMLVACGGGSGAATTGTTATTSTATTSTTSSTAGGTWTIGAAGGTFEAGAGAFVVVVPPGSGTHTVSVTAGTSVTPPQSGKDYVPKSAWNIPQTSLGRAFDVTLSFPTSDMPANSRIYEKIDGKWVPLPTFLDRDAKKANGKSIYGWLSDYAMFAYSNGDWDWSAAGKYWYKGLTISMPDGGVGPRAVPSDVSPTGVSTDWVPVTNSSYGVTHNQYSVVVPGQGIIATIQAPVGSVPDDSWGLVRTYQKVVNQGYVAFVPTLDKATRTATTAINSIGHLAYTWSLAYFSHPLMIDYLSETSSKTDVVTLDVGRQTTTVLYSLSTAAFPAQGVGLSGGFRFDDHSFIGTRMMPGADHGEIVKVDAATGAVTSLLTLNADPGWHIDFLQCKRSSHAGSTNTVGIAVRFADAAEANVRDELLSFIPGGAVSVLRDETMALSSDFGADYVCDVAANGDVLGYAKNVLDIYSPGGVKGIYSYDRDNSFNRDALFSTSGNRILYHKFDGDLRIVDRVTNEYFQSGPYGTWWAHNDNYNISGGAGMFNFIDVRSNAKFTVPNISTDSVTVFQVR